MKVRIYTDGSALQNPGPGGYAAILQYMDPTSNLHERELSGGEADTTNNRMELMAAIIGLEALKRPCEVELYSDSRYLTDSFNKGWLEQWEYRGWKTAAGKDVLNVDLWERLLKAIKSHRVKFIWIKGHSGHPENERCDVLAKRAAERSRE